MSPGTTTSAPPPDDAPTAPGVRPSAPPAPGFFSWLRALGVQRQDGWLGGVCAGIGIRTGLDPLLVRGIAVVLAVVGAPVVLLYAVAWFLLPDAAGTIHAQELGRGRVTPALPGIAAVGLLSLLPLTQGFWSAGALYWGDLGWGGAIGRTIWTALLLAGATVVVVWLARRTSGDVPLTPATTDDRPDTVPNFPAETADAAPGPAAHSAAPFADPGEPPAPPADASAEELANWRTSQEEWQKQRAAWAAEQRRHELERRRGALREQIAEATRLEQERARIRRLTHPRAHAGIVFLVLGLALVSGAIAAFVASRTPATHGAEWMIGAAVLVLVLGLGTVATALGRRRSGALAFFSMLAVVALLVSIVVPTDRTLIPLGAAWGIDTTRDGRYAQLAGNTHFTVEDRDRPVTIDLWQLAGDVTLTLGEGAAVRLDFTTDARNHAINVEETTNSAASRDVAQRYAEYQVRDGRLVLTAGEGEPDLVLRLWAGSPASVHIYRWGTDGSPLPLDPVPDNRWAFDGHGAPLDPTPAPTPTPTRDADTSGEGEAP